LFIQSSYVLKMSENKEEIQYILKYKKEKNTIQLAKKICDVYKHDAVSVRVAQSWFKRFQSGILMSKMNLAPVDQLLIKSIKSWKKLSKTGTLAVMISVRN